MAVEPRRPEFRDPASPLLLLLPFRDPKILIWAFVLSLRLPYPTD